jgi:starch-binding outer membrane protein, SusD/RagB family
MKNSIKIVLISLLMGMSTSSCEEYLDVPPDATLTEESVFSTYNTFQGFIDPLYDLVSDPNSHCLSGSANYGTESLNVRADLPVGAANVLDYIKLGYGGGSYWTGNVAKTGTQVSTVVDGLWDFWPYACRIANISLKNLDKLKDTSKEDRDKLEGQALFFRAYFNYQIVIAYGTIPYLDEIYDQDNIQQPRHWTDTKTGKKDCQAVLEKAARDLERAAELLPETWPGAEIGRITKGASYALLAKVLLFAGSPLFEEVSEKGVVSADETPFDKEYMTRAATAAAQVFKLNRYSLTPFGTTNSTTGDGIKRMFITIDKTVPWTDEVIFRRFTSSGGADWAFWARIFVKGDHGTPTGGCENPQLLFMDKFEMKDGTQYKPGNSDVGGYDDNLTKFNDERDPRFQYNYYLHGEKIFNYTLNFSNGGKAQASVNAGPFLLTKLWLHGVDAINGTQSGNFNYGTPLLRLADVYLMYAEAVFEATGNPDASIGGGPTARQALNLVRARASMPEYNPATYATARINHGELASDDPFRLAVRNERNVELAYEGHYWFDLRRWKRFHRLDSKLWILNFTQANPNVLSYTNVSRIPFKDFPVLLKHYWLPFSQKDTQYYKEFEQNPGW